MIEHLLIWQIDETMSAESMQKDESAKIRRHSMVNRLQKDLNYYNCTHIQFADDHGYALIKGKLSDIMLDLVKYSPFLKFKFKPACDIDRIRIAFKQMKQETIQDLPNARILEKFSLDGNT